MDNITYQTIYKLYTTLNNNNNSGRKLKKNFKHYLDNIFYVLRYGIPWNSLPYTGLHYTTYHKFYTKLISLNIFELAYKILSKKYYYKNKDQFKNIYIDSSMIKNINGSEFTGKNHYDRNRKGNKITVLVNDYGVPISIHLSKANTHDSTLIMDALNNSTIKIIRSRLIADKGYINPTVKKKLRRTNNISLIYPYRKNQNKKNTSYENNLLKKRHIVENFFSWLKKYRRIQQRYDSSCISYLNFIYFGCINIIAKKLTV